MRAERETYTESQRRVIRRFLILRLRECVKGVGGISSVSAGAVEMKRWAVGTAKYWSIGASHMKRCLHVISTLARVIGAEEKL